jgi:hypothetical protein
VRADARARARSALTGRRRSAGRRCRLACQRTGDRTAARAGGGGLRARLGCSDARGRAVRLARGAQGVQGPALAAVRPCPRHLRRGGATPRRVAAGAGRGALRHGPAGRVRRALLPSLPQGGAGECERPRSPSCVPCASSAPARTAQTFLVCGECKHARYCSNTCVAACRKLHSLECPALARSVAAPTRPRERQLCSSRHAAAAATRTQAGRTGPHRRNGALPDAAAAAVPAAAGSGGGGRAGRRWGAAAALRGPPLTRCGTDMKSKLKQKLQSRGGAAAAPLKDRIVFEDLMLLKTYGVLASPAPSGHARRSCAGEVLRLGQTANRDVAGEATPPRRHCARRASIPPLLTGCAERPAAGGGPLRTPAPRAGRAVQCAEAQLMHARLARRRTRTTSMTWTGPGAPSAAPREPAPVDGRAALQSQLGVRPLPVVLVPAALVRAQHGADIREGRAASVPHHQGARPPPARPPARLVA